MKNYLVIPFVFLLLALVFSSVLGFTIQSAGGLSYTFSSGSRVNYSISSGSPAHEMISEMRSKPAEVARKRSYSIKMGGRIPFVSHNY